MLYVADPMCPWCWGFALVIDHLTAEYAGTMRVDLPVGGLWVGTREPLTADQRQWLPSHWRHIESVTGQPFDGRSPLAADCGVTRERFETIHDRLREDGYV